MIFVEGDEKYAIFSNTSCKEKYIEIFKKNETRYSFKLIAERFFESTALIIIKISDIPTSKIMQSVLTSFSKYLTSYTKQTGKKLKDRYKAFPIKKEFIDEILSMELSELLSSEKTKRFIQKKGININYKRHNKRTLSLEAQYLKILYGLAISTDDKEAKHAHIILLRKYTQLTNRQIAAMENISESMVSKILSKESYTYKENLIISRFENII